MTFTPGIPASGQSLGSSRLQVLNNFAVLRSTIATNHIDVNNSGAGKHNLAEFVAQATSPATTVNEAALYSKSSGGVIQLFIQKANQLVGATDIPITRFDVGIAAGNTGWTFLPGGFIMQWGSCGVVNGAYTTNYVARGGVNFANNTYMVMLTVDDPGIPTNPITSFPIQKSSFTASGFSGNTNRAITLAYLAIGI